MNKKEVYKLALTETNKSHAQQSFGQCGLCGKYILVVHIDAKMPDGRRL